MARKKNGLSFRTTPKKYPPKKNTTYVFWVATFKLDFFLGNMSDRLVMTLCSNCNREAKKVINCPRCKQDIYCSDECRRAKWNKHKRVCVRASKTDTKRDLFNEVITDDNQLQRTGQRLLQGRQLDVTKQFILCTINTETLLRTPDNDISYHVCVNELNFSDFEHAKGFELVYNAREQLKKYDAKYALIFFAADPKSRLFSRSCACVLMED